MFKTGHSNPYNNYTIGKKFRVVIEHTSHLPYVEKISQSMYFTPYLRDDAFYPSDSISIDGKNIRFNIRIADEATHSVFRPQIIEGSWKMDNNMEDGSFPIIITKQFADQIKWNSSVGRKINYQGISYTVVGVVNLSLIHI